MEVYLEQKVLGKFVGAKASWRRRNHNKVYKHFAEPNIPGVVISYRVRWIDHVMSMKNYRIPRMILSVAV